MAAGDHGSFGIDHRSCFVLVITESVSNLLIAIPILTLGVGIPLWLLCQTHYTFSGSELLIRSGPFSWKIAVADIRSVVPTRNPLASPALSLDRLQINYGPGKTLMVSPSDKEGFLASIQTFNSSSAQR